MKAPATLVVAVLFAALLAAVAGVESAKAGSQGSAGSIAFTSDRRADADGVLDIYQMDADGRGPTRKLTDAPGDNVMPAWSAGGTQIAFVRSGFTGIPNIYRMDADGSNETPVTSGSQFNTDPAWFPVGRRIIFSRGENIYAMTLNASGDATAKLTRLTRTSSADRQPAVSPDGKMMAFASNRDGDFDIYVMKANAPEGPTNRPVKLTRNSTADLSPDWSPSGKRIAFTRDRQGTRDVYVMKAVPQDMNTNPPDNLTANAADDSDPAWSPDGEWIAFSSDRTGDYEIWQMSADGTNPTNLTRSRNSQDIQPAWQPLP